MRFQVLFLLLITALFFTGCAKKYDFEEKPVSTSYKEEIARHNEMMSRNEATSSLWTEVGSRGTLFLDYKGRQVGDIIVVNIVESSSATNSNSTSTSRESSHANGITNILGLPANLGVTNFLGMGNPLDPTLETDSSSSFSGSGSKNKSDSVSATIAARITDVLPSGNLVIEGHREIIVDQEKQIIKISGIVRQKDISATNTVDSTAIADARITYSGKGIITDSNRKGWMSTFFDWVWPF